MSRWGIVTLPARIPWQLETLLPAPPVIAAPPDFAGPSRSLGELCYYLPPHASSDTGSPVVTPGSLDPDSWIIRRTSPSSGGNVHRAGAEGLRLGDLLCPPGAAPVILYGPVHLGLSFARSFRLFRPQATEPLLLWAILNSESGRKARAAGSSSIGDTRWRGSTLGQLLIPELQLTSTLRQRLQDLWSESVGSVDPETVGGSQWSRVNVLNAPTWDPATLAFRSDDSADHMRIEEAVELIRYGSVRAVDQMDVPIHGSLPVLTPGAVRRGGAANRWTLNRPSIVLAAPGDVVFTSVGLRSRALVVTESAAVGHGLILLRPRRLAPDHLADFLNGAEGQALLRRSATGDFIPHLTIRALKALPIPFPAEPANRSDPRRPPDEQLEQALWA